MPGSTTVGLLKVILSADSAQITSDLGRARKAVASTRDEFRVFGRSGKDAEKVLIDIGTASPRELGKARQAVQVLTSSFGSLGGTVGKVGTTLGEFATGGLGAAGAAVTAAVAAVTFAIYQITSSWEEMKKAEEEYAKGSKDRASKSLLASAEALDRKVGGSYHKIAVLVREAEEAERKEAAARKEFESGGWGLGFWGSKNRPQQKAEWDRTANEAEAARARMNEAVTAQVEKEREAVEGFRRELQGLAKERALDEFRRGLEGLSPPLRKAEEEIRRLHDEFEGKFKAAAKEAGLSSDSGLNIEGLEKQAALRREMTDELERQSDHLRQQARLEDAKPYRERLQAARESLRLLREGLDPQSKEARLQTEIADLEKKKAAATGMLRFHYSALLAGRYAELEVEKGITAEVERQARAKKAGELAVSMRAENDLGAALRGAGGNERKEALVRLDAERKAALAGLAEGSKEYLDLVREFRRKEEDINREYDAKALAARMDFVDRVAEVRRQAARATLLDDKNLTKFLLDEEDARHDALMREVNAAQVRGDLSEEDALRKKNAAYASHIDLRLAIQREGKDREIAWEAAFQDRLRSLQTEGETDEEKVVRLGTEQRVAALQEETRRVVEEYRLRGELTKAAEVKAASEQAEARIRREGQLRGAIAGNDFGAGFEARVSQMRTELGGLGRVGAATAEALARGLSDGVVGALDEVIQGTKTAKQAFRDWARSLLLEIAQIIQRALLMKAVLEIFPGLGGAPAPGGGGAAPPVPGSATGGTYRVMGWGGLDTKLVSMRLSPGELVKVANGAASGRGGDGDLFASVVVRNQIAPDWIARNTSREAKAEVVATALHRGSRRGARAPE